MANPILAAAWLAGIREVYSIGGAQGVAAAIYGTRSVRPVDRVFGPGNDYVQAAKWLAQGGAGLEGPSELLILADNAANPQAVAADLVAQAEHTGNEWAVLVTPSRGLVDRVIPVMNRMISRLPRAQEAARSLSRHGDCCRYW